MGESSNILGQEYSKHKYDLDVVDIFHRVGLIFRRHPDVSNIDIHQLRIVAAMEMVRKGIQTREAFKHNIPVILHRVSDEGSFYWWLSLALAVEKPALIGFRLNYLLKKEVGNEERFLHHIEFTVLELMLHHEIPNSENATEKVACWISKNPSGKIGATKRKYRRKKETEENPFHSYGVPLIIKDLKEHIAGLEQHEINYYETDYSGDMLQALFGKNLKFKILLDLNQAEIFHQSPC
jgi:hypothetical protein